MSHPKLNKNENGLLMIEETSKLKMRNSIIYNYVIENLISNPIDKTEIDEKRIKIKKEDFIIKKNLNYGNFL